MKSFFKSREFKLVIAIAIGLLFVTGIAVFHHPQANHNVKTVTPQPKPKTKPTGFSEQETTDAIGFAKRFVNTYFQVHYKQFPKDFQAQQSHYEKEFKPYLTDKAYKVFMTNQQFTQVRISSVDHQLNVTVKEIHVQLKGDNTNRKNLNMDYQTELSFQNDNGETKYVVPVKGQLTLVKTDGHWKIDRSWNDFMSSLPDALKGAPPKAS